MSLHACGVATDLVIQKCIENKASFVSCPCCYGSVQENHMVSYPRSQIFKEVPIAFKVSFSWDYTSELLDEAFRGGQKKPKLKKKVSKDEKCIEKQISALKLASNLRFLGRFSIFDQL